MANPSICAELDGEIDLSCARTLVKKYFQEAVIINLSDIDRTASVVNLDDGATCDYTVEMVLKAGKKGVMIKLPENGGTIKGTVNKTTSDLGMVQYVHATQIFLAGITTAIKCALDKLDRGRYAVALQATDGTVEIYGFYNGMTTGDYTWDLVEGGGATVIPIQSKEDEQESLLPLIYKSGTLNGENADFNEQFAQTV